MNRTVLSSNDRVRKSFFASLLSVQIFIELSWIGRQRCTSSVGLRRSYKTITSSLETMMILFCFEKCNFETITVRRSATGFCRNCHLVKISWTGQRSNRYYSNIHTKMVIRTDAFSKHGLERRNLTTTTAKRKSSGFFWYPSPQKPSV